MTFLNKFAGCFTFAFVWSLAIVMALYVGIVIVSATYVATMNKPITSLWQATPVIIAENNDELRRTRYLLGQREALYWAAFEAAGEMRTTLDRNYTTIQDQQNRLFQLEEFIRSNDLKVPTEEQ